MAQERVDNDLLHDLGGSKGGRAPAHVPDDANARRWTSHGAGRAFNVPIVWYELQWGEPVHGSSENGSGRIRENSRTR